MITSKKADKAREALRKLESELDAPNSYDVGVMLTVDQECGKIDTTYTFKISSKPAERVVGRETFADFAMNCAAIKPTNTGSRCSKYYEDRACTRESCPRLNINTPEPWA